MKELRSPLAELEELVLRRAKDEALDLDDADTDSRIRALLDDEVARWRSEHQHGLREIDLVDPEYVIAAAERNLLGYGPLEELLDDEDVWEIMVNAPGEIFAKRHRGVSGYHHGAFHDDDHVARTLTKILDDANSAHRKLDPAEGLQDAQLDDGARLHIVHRDVGRGGHLLVNIRKFTGVAIRHLDELVTRGMLTSDAARFLRAAVGANLSMIVAGPPGSGKTTLLACCTAAIDPTLRVVTAEEVFELDVPHPNVAAMQTRAARPERAAVDLRRLVSGFLRMAPDVAIVGEVRDREALPLLLTLSSGVTGYATIHAGSAGQALSRLRLLAQLTEVGANLPISALNALVSESVDIVVHCARVDGTPKVTEIIAIEGQRIGDDAIAFSTSTVYALDVDRVALERTGNVPVRAAAALRVADTSLPESAMDAEVGG